VAGVLVQLDTERGHADVVHAGDPQRHDRARAERGEEAPDSDGGPRSGGRGEHGDDDGEPDQGGVVPEGAVEAQGGHAEAAHGGHPYPGDRAGEEQGQRSGAPEADDADAAEDHQDGDGEAEDGQETSWVEGACSALTPITPMKCIVQMPQPGQVIR
jgi:hypothetical protein